MERNRVLVSGLSREISRSDLTMYFQSRKKSGGGEVIDIKFLDQRNAILTFQNEVDANNVLSRQHFISGFEIYITVPPRNMESPAPLLTKEDSGDETASEESSKSDEDDTGDPEELCAVQVDDLSPKTTKDSIQNYFENKNKSKGGAVRKVELYDALNVAKVVFRHVEDAKRVAQYKKHKLDEASLRVALVRPLYETQEEKPIKGKKETVSDKSREEALPLEFVISGISEKITKDALVNYLENTRRSGGGDVIALKFDEEEEGIAEVKFRNVKSLDQLLYNQHRIDDSNLNIEVKEPEKEVPSDPCKVHVKGLSPATTKDGLELYMEKMSKGDIVNMQRGSYGNVLITFKEPIDFEVLSQKIESDGKGLEGRKPILERVPFCCCIQVSALDDKTTEDSLRLYFENQKRGVGIEPSEVDLQGEGRALVYFDDPSVIEKALGKRHVLENAELKMELFFPFLNEERLPTKGKRKRKETKSEVIDIDPDIMAHISKRYGEELEDLLNEAAIDLKWEPEEGSAIVTEKPSVATKSGPWVKRMEFLQKYLHDFECAQIRVDDGAWDEVREAVTQELVSTNDFSDADITIHESTKEIRITGKRNCLQMPVSAVQTLVRGIQEDKALQDTIETKVERDLEPGKLGLLKISSLYKDLQGSYKHLQMEIQEDEGEVIIKGPRKDLQEISIELYKFCSKVKEEVLELPERILGVLETPKGRDFVCKSLSQNQIQAVLVHGQRKSKNEASIFATNKEQARQAMKHIETFSKERSIHLKDENIPVTKSEKWNELVTSIEAQSVVSVCLEERCQTIWIRGVEPDVLECFKVLESYIDNNTILKDFVEVSDGCLRFIFQTFENEIRDLHGELRDAFVRVQPGGCGEITITGTGEGIEKGKEAVMSLVQRVFNEEIKVDKPGMKKLLKSSKGAKVVKNIETENKCTVELVDLDQLEKLKAGSMKELRGAKRRAAGEIICSYTTSKGKRLVVYKDDLTRHHVEVIVNAANENLQHVGGLAGDIVRVGGQEIQDECDDYIRKHRAVIEGHVMETGPGKLPCKTIVHAVGPRWDSARSARKKRILGFTFENCLEKAKNRNSIAIPAVSAGIFGFPLDLCASILVETVVKFFQDNPYCNLSEVHFTNNDDKTVKAFSDEMKKRFGRERAFSEGITTTPSSSRYDQNYGTASTSFSASASDKVLTTPEGVSLFVKAGDISQEKADVLVNTAGEDLKLQKNACARSFSKAAGPSLQRYCDNISPVGAGDIGVTKPGKLKCQYVFHAVCDDWNSGRGEKILRGILQKCFNEAERRGANSIAIPAIGTGILQFPRDDVARISFEEVISFSKRRPSSLKEVRFVLYDEDDLTVQAFRDELARRSSRSTPFTTPKRRTTRRTTTSTLTKRKDDWFQVDMDELSVHVQRGDITQESTDAIVVVSNPELDLTIGGGAGTAILNAGGPFLARECQQHPTLQMGDVTMTSAGSLQVSNLIHYVPSSNSLDEALLVRGVIDCLQFADQNGLTSVSFPAVGTGNLGLSANHCAKAMLKAFHDFSRRNPTSVQLVRVVIFQKSMLKPFYSEMKEFVGEVPDKDENPGFFRRLTNLVGLTSEEDRELPEIEHEKSSEVVLRVYSGDQRKLDAAVRAITEMISENCKRQVINNEAIAHLDQNHRRKMCTIERQFDCKIRVEVPVQRIIIEGNSEDILGALSKIHEMLHEVIKRCEQAELLAKDVQWLYEAQDGFTPYSRELNAKIESAYKKKEKEVTFEDDDEEFKICFSRKEEISKDGITKVTRRALGEISLPDNWDPQPIDQNSGSEVTAHLVELDHRKHVQEYLKISNLVKKTLSRTNTIKKIQRVQNPAQYKIYAVKKQRMDEKNGRGSNEKLLFHGTRPENCDNINVNGLNRSFAGRNATMYGQGVYFAVAAEYSARSNYSPPDTQGNRYMYLARVLTGEYTVGDQSMTVAPPKNPASPTDCYDTVVDDVTNPGIFVAFYDWQCYPEYLITFQ